MDMATLVRQGAERFHASPIVICDRQIQTYGECYERASRLARALADLGLRPGDRVATLTDNSPQALELVFGIALGGFVRASLYTHNTAEINAHLMTVIGASALIVQHQHLAEIAPYADQVAGLRHLVVCDGPAAGAALDYEDVLAAAAAEDPHVEVAQDRPQTIRFSAGTTGRPKPIVHDVAGWTAVGAETASVLPTFTPDDRYLVAGPLSHASFMSVPAILSVGGSLALMRRFDPETFLAQVAELRGTFTFGVPTMIHAVATHPSVSTFDLSSIRCVAYGGSPITAQTMHHAREVFGDVLVQIYGQSEGAPLTFLSPADHVAQNGKWLGSAGRPAPHAQVRIVDDDGSELPQGQVGEVAALTPTAFAGVWDDDEATKARFLPDGAVLTRDVGYLDDDGYLFVTGRKGDMIISGGHNIWPIELEKVLVEHPAVAEAAVVGIPHDRWGETPLGLIVVRDGAAVTADELVAWTRAKLGPIKKLGAVVFGAELPLSPMGKLLRHKVRDQYAAASPVTSDDQQSLLEQE